jgi:hypothetical protein
MHNAAPFCRPPAPPTIGVLDVETYVTIDGRSLTVTGTVDMDAFGRDWDRSVADVVRVVDEDTGEAVSLDRCGEREAKTALMEAASHLWARKSR